MALAAGGAATACSQPNRSLADDPAGNLSGSNGLSLVRREDYARARLARAAGELPKQLAAEREAARNERHGYARAKHVTVGFGGVGRGLNHAIGEDLFNNNALYSSATREENGTLVLTWIGYHAPAELDPAMRFADDARQRGPLPVDDLILIGSPGIPQKNPAEFGLPGHVWASVATADRIDSGLVTVWHGNRPTDHSFGAKVFFGNNPPNDHGKPGISEVPGRGNR